MAKLVLEIDKPLKNNDILIYKKGKFVPTDVNVLFVEVNKEIKELKKEIETLKLRLECHAEEIKKNAKDILIDRGIIDEE